VECLPAGLIQSNPVLSRGSLICCGKVAGHLLHKCNSELGLDVSSAVQDCGDCQPLQGESTSWNSTAQF